MHVAKSLIGMYNILCVELHYIITRGFPSIPHAIVVETGSVIWLHQLISLSR